MKPLLENKVFVANNMLVVVSSIITGENWTAADVEIWRR